MIIRVMVLILCFYSFSAFSGTIDCEPVNGDPFEMVHGNFELNPSGTNITLGSNVADWSVLYTLNHVSLGAQHTECPEGTNVAYLYYSSYTTLLNTISGKKIYATNVPGIGISIATYWGASSKKNIGPYPDYDAVGTLAEDNWFDIDVTFWKIPGTIPMAGGAISIDGPEVAIMYYGNTYTMTSHNDPSRIVPFSGDTSGTGYLAYSKILHATLMFQPGTCNIEGNHVRVNMGKYDGSGGQSAWKDASFKLICPDGFGYGGTYTGEALDPDAIDPNGTRTANNTKNGRVMLSIIPYTEVIDANKGIIALDGSGAQGYGIQLAWGDYSSQNTVEPAKPVILNSYFDANSLNSAFLAGDTPIGGNAFNGTDNTIKMAARYVRTEGKATAGPANAAVEVIATYE